MPPKNSGGSTKFPGGHKVIRRTAQTAFVRVVTPRMISSLKDKMVEKRKEVEQLNQKSMEVQAQVADVKSQVQTNVDQMIAIIEARKQDVFNAVEYQAKKSLQSLSQKKGEVENQRK